MNVFVVVATILSAAGPSDAVARVDGTKITVADLAQRLEAAARGTSPEQALQTMIDEALLSAEGRRLGLDRSPLAAEHLEAAQRAEAGAAFLRKEIAARTAPDEEQLRTLFHSTADFVAFDQLTFENDEGASASLARIRKGGSFEAEARHAVASRVQPDPKQARLVMRAELPSPLAAVLFAAEPGAVVGPIPVTEGAAVARLLRKVVGSDAEFMSRRPSLTAYAQKQLTEQMKGHVLAQLRERAHVSLDEPFLRSIDDIEPTSQQLDHVLATVGKTKLRYRDIFDTVRAIRAAGGHMGAALRVAVAWREIDSRLLQEVAVERGFLNAPEVIAARERHRDSAVGYAAMRRIMDGAPPPSEDEIVGFYERNSAGFRRPFAQVLPQATAGAAREKREAAFRDAVMALRKKATISVDRDALARSMQPGR